MWHGCAHSDNFVVHVWPCNTACVQVASAFSQMLNLHNLSEEISSAQTERAARMGEVYAVEVILCVVIVTLATTSGG